MNDNQDLSLKQAEWAIWLKRLLPVFFLLVTPGLSWVLFELIVQDLHQIGTIYILLNLLFFYVIYLSLFLITNHMKIIYPLLNILFVVIALAEYFVVSFRARPILIWDVMAFQTALTVSENYTYEITPLIVAGVGSIFLLSAGAACFPFCVVGKRKRIGAAVCGAAVCAGWFSAFYLVMVPGLPIEINLWDPYASYCEKGYPVATLVSFTYLKAEPPAGYSVQAVEAAAQDIGIYKQEPLSWTGSTDVVPENIICIMNESFADLRVIGRFQTDTPFLEYYDSLEENCIKGNLYMPVFGSMTCNSEYEFLTGNSMAFAPEGSVPYQTYMYAPVYGLASSLKAQGYRTVGMHPNAAGNWNRDEAFQAMGFDEFLSGEYFADSPLLRNYVSDKGNYDKIIQVTESKEEGQPLFLFDVTMQNHGGYDIDFESSVHLEDGMDFPLTEQYLSLVKESDQALSYLLKYYENIQEPTMILMFGDHQPSIEEEFYDMTYGRGLDMTDADMEDYSRRYITPFLIWTNYDMPSQTIDRMSDMYLAAALTSVGNLKLTEYQYFLNHLYTEAPVIHIYGYYNSGGQWESWNGWMEKKEYKTFHQLELLQYNNMFGKKKRMNRLFDGSVSP